MGELDIFDYLLSKPEVNYSNKSREQVYMVEEAYGTYLSQNDI